jgi:hypothetical protein
MPLLISLSRTKLVDEQADMLETQLETMRINELQVLELDRQGEPI